jgi:uncharacterized protein with gpF-like domain
LKKESYRVAHEITFARTALGKADGGDPDLHQVVDAILEKLNLDWGDLTPELQQAIIRIATDGVSVAFDQIGVTPSIDVLQQANAKAIEYAQQRAGELVTMIADSTREMIRSDVTTALEEGMSSADLADALEARYAFSADRAETIARTELAIADVQGNLAAYRASGVVSGKEWVLGSEHDEMDECDDAADLGVVDLDDDFGGLGDPPAHPNCVCDVLPVLSDESDTTTEE